MISRCLFLSIFSFHRERYQDCFESIGVKQKLSFLINNATETIYNQNTSIHDRDQEVIELN